MNTYCCFYRRDMIEVMADTSYEAQKKAAWRYKIPRKAYKIAVVLVELTGARVEFDTASV